MFNEENNDFISLEKDREESTLTPLEVSHNHKHNISCDCCGTKTKDMSKLWLGISIALTCILMIVGLCSVGSNKESVEIFKSDLAGDRAVVTTVNGDGKIYSASEIYANNGLDS